MLAPPVAPPALALSGPPSGARVTLSVSGAPGQSYRIESSADLGSWTLERVVTLESSAESLPIDLPVGPARYFRLVAP